MEFNGEKVLDEIHERGPGVSAWCRQHGVNRRTFYNVVKGQRGSRRDARESRRIIGLLRAQGYLVDSGSHGASVQAASGGGN